MIVPLDVKQMTHSALERFVAAVDTVMDADQIDARERRDLICWWAYQYDMPDMPQQLSAAIARCQGEPVHPTASSIVSAMTGETVAYSC